MADKFRPNERVMVDSPRPNHMHCRGVDGHVIECRGSRAKHRPNQVQVRLGGMWGRGWFYVDELSPFKEAS